MKDKTFVRDVADHFGCDDRRAEMLIFAVFQELRDRLTPAEAADVAALNLSGECRLRGRVTSAGESKMPPNVR